MITQGLMCKKHSAAAVSEFGCYMDIYGYLNSQQYI